MSRQIKIAIVVSHPIQHFCPQYASFAQNPDVAIKVFFGSALGYKKYNDVNFQQEIYWTNLRLEKFHHVFLNGDEVRPAHRELDAPSLETELELFNPDIIIIYGYFQKLQRRAKRWAIKRKISMAYISDAENRSPRNLAKDILKSFFLRRYFKSFKYFLTVGDANESYYKKYHVPSHKLMRMHFPIDIEFYRSSYPNRSILSKSLREIHQIPADALIMAVVGKLVSWKNQEDIIAAMQLLEQRNIYTHLFIIGSGPRDEFLKEKSTSLRLSKVYFTGFLNPEKLPAYYAATDIYVHPASVEPHSLSISEAIYMGCPVILSDRCGSHGETDDVTDGENGFVYPFGDTTILAEKIEQLIKDQTLRNNFSIKSHEKAERFQLKAHVEILKSLVKKESALD